MIKKSIYLQSLIYFCLYNIVFLCMQYAFAFTYSVDFINTIPLPSTVYIAISLTILAHFFLYLLLSLIQTSLIWGLMQCKFKIISDDRCHIIIWTLSIIALITANCYFFPLSLMSKLLIPEVPITILQILLLISVLILSVLLLNTLFFIVKQNPKVTSSFILILLSFIYLNDTKNVPINSEPNIIFIGIDSLSPHNLSNQHTPTINQFMNSGVVFKETISPLARTYPSWTSILTGLYPFHNNARYNLMPKDLVNSSQSIAFLLKKLNYETMYATDDRRFNNIGEEFGFNKIIGPKIGASDFIIGAFNDFPLSNLIINLKISQFLFPYNYINRASFVNYYPKSFDNALKDNLILNRHKKIFMAIHFTLAHWPYAWASSSPADLGNEYSITERQKLYLSSLERVDKEVKDLLQVLQQNGYLENSLVVLLSDHGEAMYNKGSRQTSLDRYQSKKPSIFADYLKRKTGTNLQKSFGHGSDLLSYDQYHCVLAFKIYKHNKLISSPKVINERVALIDIFPTLEDYLKMPAKSKVDGISLLNYINNKDLTPPSRTFIMESGILPNQILDRDKAKEVAKKLYEIDSKNGHVQIKKSKLKELNSQKLYAVIENNWLVALYPDDNGYIPITVNTKNGKWDDSLNTDFVKKSPAMNMLSYMQKFYKINGSILIAEFTGYREQVANQP